MSQNVKFKKEQWYLVIWKISPLFLGNILKFIDKGFLVDKYYFESIFGEVIEHSEDHLSWYEFYEIEYSDAIFEYLMLFSKI